MPERTLVKEELTLFYLLCLDVSGKKVKLSFEHLCHGKNGQKKNPPTHKRPMAVSRGKMSMDLTP